MGTQIQSNGGGRVLPIEDLLQRLRDHPLDRSFEAFGDFVIRDPKNGRGEPLAGPGAVLFFGNFFTYSHVFNIVTDEPELIATLSDLIRQNQQRSDYRDQPAPRLFRTSWLNSQTLEAGEFLTRDAAEAYEHAQRKRSEGCRAGVDRVPA